MRSMSSIMAPSVQEAVLADYYFNVDFDDGLIQGFAETSSPAGPFGGPGQFALRFFVGHSADVVHEGYGVFAHHHAGDGVREVHGGLGADTLGEVGEPVGDEAGVVVDDVVDAALGVGECGDGGGGRLGAGHE